MWTDTAHVGSFNGSKSATCRLGGEFVIAWSRLKINGLLISKSGPKNVLWLENMCAIKIGSLHRFACSYTGLIPEWPANKALHIQYFGIIFTSV